MILLGLTAFALIFGMYFLGGCSDAKQSSKGWNKFIKNGGSVTCDTIYQKQPYLLKDQFGNDSIGWKLVPCNCPDVKEPLTRWETRHLEKHEKDSLKRIERLQRLRYEFIIDSLEKINKLAKIEGNTKKSVAKQETKQVKSNDSVEKKKAFPWMWFFLFLSTLSVLIFVLINKFKRTPPKSPDGN